MKKAILAVSFLLMFSTCFAAITNYTVPEEVPLNNTLTIFGTYSGGANQLCSFFLFDVEDQNQAIIRLSDEYTNSLGEFYSEYQITEPLFRRGIDYNAVTVCGTDKVNQNFYVQQKEDIAFGITSEAIRNEWAFWTDSENSLTVVVTVFAIIVVAAIAALIMRA